MPMAFSAHHIVQTKTIILPKISPPISVVALVHIGCWLCDSSESKPSIITLQSRPAPWVYLSLTAFFGKLFVYVVTLFIIWFAYSTSFWWFEQMTWVVSLFQLVLLTVFPPSCFPRHADMDETKPSFHRTVELSQASCPSVDLDGHTCTW